MTVLNYLSQIPVSLCLAAIFVYFYFRGQGYVHCEDKTYGQIFRHSFIHTSLLHLSFNLYALYQCSLIERKYGTSSYFLLIAFLLVLTNYIEFELTYLHEHGYWPFAPCSVGFSAILLGIVVFEKLYLNSWVIDESIIQTILILLVIPVIQNPKVSLTGHLSGIIAAVALALLARTLF